MATKLLQGNVANLRRNHTLQNVSPERPVRNLRTDDFLVPVMESAVNEVAAH